MVWGRYSVPYVRQLVLNGLGSPLLVLVALSQFALWQFPLFGLFKL